MYTTINLCKANKITQHNRFGGVKKINKKQQKQTQREKKNIARKIK